MSFAESTVADADHDIRLDRWFKRHHPGVPHSMLEKQLRKGLIRLDGKKAKTSDRVQAGQVIRYPQAELAVTSKTPKPRRPLSDADTREAQSWVLYKDDNIIVINKPFGLAVQGGSKVTRSVDGLLDALCFGAERPRLIHRIDRDTSGILVLARNARVANLLMKGFAGKTIEKTYWALVHGCPLQLAGEIDVPIAKQTYDDGFERMGVDAEEGKFAITQYRVKEALARKFAVMELKPLTGRTHQLRVHMSSIGCPIVGDHKYGGSMDEPGNSDAGTLGVEDVLHLHARRIVIPAPGGGKTIDVSAPLPAHMVNSFRALGLDVPKK
jgi:23S rRNA pseudouridine955/2504/2580 synthase